MPKTPKIEKRDLKRPPAHFLRDIDLAERYCVHRKSVWRWAREGLLPPPVRLAGGTTRWKLRDIVEWEESR